jgi:predicted flap endonuclease-1-like 5' DNA nuclease
MFDVVRDILLCLLIAAFLGFTIGWLARGLRARRLAAVEAAASRRALQEARALLRVTESARAAEQRELGEVQNAAEFARRQAETLRRDLNEVETARDTARQEASGTREQLAKLSARLAEAETARETAKVEVDASRTAVAGARLRVVEIESQRDAVRQENERLKTLQVPTPPADESTRQRLETLKATLQAAETGWDSARAHAESALQHLSATRRQLAESEVDRNALAAQLAEALADLVTLRSRHDVVLTPVAQGDLLVPQAAPAARPRVKPVRDDLQQIRGIGPAVERTLHRAGIHLYAQIANWTREDILAVGERLPGFQDRIVRDRWMAAARRLHTAKYGGPP